MRLRTTLATIALLLGALTGAVGDPAAARHSAPSPGRGARPPVLTVPQGPRLPLPHVYDTALDPARGRLIAVGGQCTTCERLNVAPVVYDLRTGATTRVRGVPGATGLLLDRSHDQLFVSRPHADEIAVLDLRTLEVTRRYDVDGGPRPMARTPGALWFAGESSELHVLDLGTGQVSRAPAVSLPSGGEERLRPLSIVADPRHRDVIVVGTYRPFPGDMYRLRGDTSSPDGVSLELLASGDTDDPTAMAFSRDGRSLYTAAHTDHTTQFDPGTLDQVRRLLVGAHFVNLDTGPGGAVVVGKQGVKGADVMLFGARGRHPYLTYDLDPQGDDSVASGSEQLELRVLHWWRKRIVAVSTDTYGENPRVRIMATGRRG